MGLTPLLKPLASKVIGLDGYELAAFQSSSYEMLGLAGTTKMPTSGKWWDSESKDMHLHLYQDFVIHMIDAATDAKETTMLDTVCLDTNIF